jgi:hypothetical protein
LGIYGLIVAVILSGKSKTPFEKILISNLLSIVTTGTYTYSSGKNTLHYYMNLMSNTSNVIQYTLTDIINS